MRRALAVGLSALLLMMALACIPADAGSDAAVSPMSISLFDSQDHEIVGNLFDEDSIDVSTDTNWNTGITTYTIEENTPLISDTRYLCITPGDTGACVLTMTAARQSGFITESGITFAFYESTQYRESDCVGKLTFTGDNDEEQTLNGVLTAGEKYYIRAWTASDYSTTEMAPQSQYTISCTMTASKAAGAHTVYYHENYGGKTEPIESRLVVNGQTYGDAPVVDRPDYRLVGWFTDPVRGEAIGADDTVDLKEDQHLYAHWIKMGDETIHVDENDNEEWIIISVKDDSIHVWIDGKSDTTRVVTTYDDYVKDGKITVDTHNTADNFSVQDAKDANEQYSVVRKVLTEKGLDVESYIVLRYADSVSCEEGSLATLLDTDCNDFRVVGSSLTISMDRGVIGTLKDLKGETHIETKASSPDKLTPEQKDRIGDLPAYDIRIMNNGNEINELGGTVTAWFEYTAPRDSGSMYVYCVLSDSSVEEIPFTYDKGIITFRTNHLSVFCLETVSDEGGGMDWIPIAIIGAVVLVILSGSALMIKKHKNKGGEQ